MNMKNLAQRIAKLTPEQRALLERKRKQKGLVAKDSARKGRTIPDRPPGPGPWPASADQVAIWFFHQLNRETAAYNIGTGVRLYGEVKLDLWERAVNMMIERHEIYRTYFVAVDGQPYQAVEPHLELKMAVSDLRDVPEDERDEAVDREVTRYIQIPFYLDQPPLLRFAGIRVRDEETVILAVIHHTLTDWWSFKVLFEELQIIYYCLLHDKPIKLPPLPIQFIDYTLFRNAWMESEDYHKQVHYWKRKLAGAPTLIDLYGDRPRPAVPSYAGARVNLRLSPELTEKIRLINRTVGATSLMTMMAAAMAFFSRYTGAKDILMGSTVTKRDYVEMERLLGYLLNILVLRGQLHEDPTFRQFLQQMKQTVLEAFENKDLPFRSLVETLNPERDMSRMPLYQIEFIFVTASGPHISDRAEIEADDDEIVALPYTSEVYNVERGMAAIDLQTSFVEHEDHYRITLEYQTDLFDEATIRRMGELMIALFEGLFEYPDTPISKLPWMSAEEREAVLVGLNATAEDWPRQKAAHQLFEAQAAAAPERTALLFEDQSLTYAELNARANRLARALMAAGIGPESRVALRLERSVEMMAALLATMKCGAAYIPLDPGHPAGRLRYIAQDAGAALTLADAASAAALEEADGRALIVDADTGADLPDDNLDMAVDPSQLAYVIYTSGSTGQPKGVAVAHHSLVNFLTTMAREPGIAPDDRLMAVTTISFDIAGLELYLPLSAGAAVILAPKQVAGDGALLARALTDSGVTVMQATPSTWRMLLTAGWQGDPDLCILCGGEALPQDLAHELAPLGKALWNLYGPTETTIWSTRTTVDPEAGVHIGKPIGNTQIYILDQNLRPVPAPVPGGLYIAGDGLARGYFQKPELTAERFLPNPFAKAPGARMYWTGDLARWRPDGCIGYLGRADFQVKVRGFRIELGEIEAALNELPEVRESVVVAKSLSGRPEDATLIAYVVFHEPRPVEALREHLRGSLPGYMVPAHFTTLDALPLTPNNKIDRNALPEPKIADESVEFVAPRDETERALADIWSAVLHADRVGVKDDFFAMGGHSLLATQAVARVADAFEVEIPLYDFFAHPTVEGMAKLLAERRAASSAAAAPPIRPVPRGADPGLDAEGRPLPLTFAQERLWFLDRMDPGAPTFNTPMSLRLSGDVDAALLRRCFEEILRRHEALRCHFGARDGEPRLIVDADQALDFREVDLRDLPLAEREAETVRRMADDALIPFDLERDRLLRVHCYRIDDRRAALLINMHHIVTDGWSQNLVLKELTALYRAFKDGRPSPLPELPIQYADFAHWQRNWLRGEVLEGQLQFWKDTLAGAPAKLDLPLDHPRPARQTHNGRTIAFSLSHPVAVALEETRRRAGATLYMALLPVYALLLSRYAAQDDLCIGSPTANRNRAKTEDLIGFFVNTLVMRLDLSGDPTFNELVAQARDVALAAYARQDVSFEQVVDRVQPARDLSRPPLFQALFSVEDSAIISGKMARAVQDMTIELQQFDYRIAKYDLSLYMFRNDVALFGNLNYNTDLFEPDTIEAFADRFSRLAEWLIKHPDQPVSRAALVDQDEARARLAEWNRSDRDFPRGESIQALFEARVAAAPDAPAIGLPDGAAVSYGSLNQRANRIAHELIARGVGPGAIVGVCLDSGPDLAAALLAVLKAGAAYAPLDPTYPQDRLSFMIQDTAMTALVTQSALFDALPAYDVNFLNLLVLDEDADALEAQTDANPAARDGGDAAAYVVYTSGTTGEPKGVHVPHRGVARLVHDREYVDIGPGDAILQLSNTAFDALTFEIWGALLSGARLCVLDKRAALEAAAFAEALQASGANVLFITTALFNQFARAKADLFNGLKAVLFGGERVDLETVRAVRDAGGPQRLLHVYGPTETVTFATWRLVDEVATTAENLPIGGPLANLRLYLADRWLQLAPIGVAGELFIGGDDIARGYLNRPALTAERFLPDPWAETEGARMYRTGDLTRRLRDGHVEFVGRIDRQIKLRGFRIELGEIEAALKSHPQVEDAVVLLRQYGHDKRLAAYLIAAQVEDAEALTRDALRRHLLEKLPEYMIPADFVTLDRFPLTPNGKLDRRALPEPEGHELSGETPFVAAETDTEKAVAAVWAELLGKERISVADNFFELGGNSLMAAQMVSRLWDRLEVDLPISAIFEQPTAAELAKFIDVAIGASRPEGEADEDEEEGRI